MNVHANSILTATSILLDFNKHLNLVLLRFRDICWLPMTILSGIIHPLHL